MTIASMQQQGYNVRAMACTLQRAPSTICRELARNTPANAAYTSLCAEHACRVRRRQARPFDKLSSDSLSCSLVMTQLDWKWSPQQIAATFKRTYPNEADAEFKIQCESARAGGPALTAAGRPGHLSERSWLG